MNDEHAAVEIVLPHYLTAYPCGDPECKTCPALAAWRRTGGGDAT